MLRSWYILFFQIPLLPEWILSLKDYSVLAKILTKTAKNSSTFSQISISAYREAAAKPGAITAMLNYYRNSIHSIVSMKDWGVIESPTLLIWGEDDIALGKELTYGTQTYVKNLQIHYIPDCSHWVQQEKPELVNQYIHEWLNESVV